MGQCDFNCWELAANEILAGGKTADEAFAMRIMESREDELLRICAAAFILRKAAFGRRVDLHVIENAKRGSCTEDCSYCMQSAKASPADSLRHPMESPGELYAKAAEASKLDAKRFCVVTAMRAPTEEVLDSVCLAAEMIRRDFKLEICASLGLLDEKAAKRLAESGVSRYNHNLETSPSHFSKTCTTHRYSDRTRTIETAKAAGLEICSGGLLGMGESLRDRVSLSFELRRLDVSSIPVNFLDPRPGTALESAARLSPSDCLRALAMFRFVNPGKEIRIAGGREKSLGWMQPLGLFIANSIFTDGYLTSGGQGAPEDMKMLADSGFEVGSVLL